LRATIGPSVGDILEIPGQLFNYVDSWFTLADGTIIHDHSGVRYPYSERSMKHAGVAFPLPHSPGGKLDILLRMKNDTSQPMNFAALVWPAQPWEDYLFAVRTWYGVFLGAILMLVIYNVFLAFTLRDVSYFFYVAYVLCLTGSVILVSGLAEEYLWPSLPAVPAIAFLSGAGTFFSVAFINYFLNIRRVWPRVFWLSSGVSAAALVLGALSSTVAFFGQGTTEPGVAVAQGSTLLAGFYFVTVAVLRFMQGVIHARFLALGMFTLLGSVALYFSYTYAFIPYNLYIGHFMEFGTLAEGMLLSLALADRISTLSREKKEAQVEALEYQRMFSRGLIQVQEDERQKFSETMHDSIGHALLILKNNLQRLSLGLQEGNHATREFMDEQVEHCVEIMRDVRHISHDLHPHMLARLGLAVALESTIERALIPAGINSCVDIVIPPDNIDPDVAITVYRVVQECLNNVLKYSEATEVSCVIGVEAGVLRAQLADNGRGFSKEDVEHSTLGLSGMGGRVQLLGGTMEIHSTPTRGTRIVFEIPIAGA